MTRQLKTWTVQIPDPLIDLSSLWFLFNLLHFIKVAEKATLPLQALACAHTQVQLSPNYSPHFQPLQATYSRKILLLTICYVLGIVQWTESTKVKRTQSLPLSSTGSSDRSWTHTQWLKSDKNKGCIRDTNKVVWQQGWRSSNSLKEEVGREMDLKGEEKASQTKRGWS